MCKLMIEWIIVLITLKSGWEFSVKYFILINLAIKNGTRNLKVEVFDKFIISLNNYIMLSLLAIKANKIM